MTLLQTHSHQTTTLYSDPHNPHNHLARGHTHYALGFSDLAAADAYRALSLLESVVDPEGCEFHARRVVRSSPAGIEGGDVRDGEGNGEDGEDGDDRGEAITKEEYDGMIGGVYALLVRGLVDCGCLRDAFDFCSRGLELFLPSTSPGNDNGNSNSNKDENVTFLEEQMRLIKKAYLARTKRNAGESHDVNGNVNLDGVNIDASTLPAQGFARRVLYPWNTHEPDRKAPETLNLLNERLKDVAPKCEVRAVALPALHTQQNHDGKGDENEGKSEEVSVQLGLFAKETIPAGEIILRESSMLTATNRLHDDLCDACNAPLPSLPASSTSDDGAGPVPCEGDDCEDTVFCSQKCHDDAQVTYHGALCGLLEGLESIGRDIPDPKDKADYLYLLLLGRAIAMAATQGVHPLDLPEVKYIWGDFHDYTPCASSPNRQQVGGGDNEAKLPFSFHLSILQPTRLLEEMALDPYAVLPSYDTWILNTLYAKFRGTASGRLSTWDGGPELCAVHPLWCLANHSCVPNVRWEWGGEITFCVRRCDERGVWRGRHIGKEWSEAGSDEKSEATGGDGRFNGIKQDEEILNHYCDIGLDVKERREWARGALGGMCLCPRCVWEDAN